ncbi:hypothetical protein [Aeromonas hydrophila]|uniref:hypothetical protein n=1 Tax=Aeromonas hydrophila TaxID=644 RepID=UPI002362965B|nr:hypothetical protein [Aeromonas hydrophila]
MSTNGQDLCLVFIPALVTLLYKAEKDKGSPLTENEVIKIRDGATCMAVQFSVALEMDEKRGYPDIVAEESWSEWQAARKTL